MIAQAKPISEVVKDFEQSLENLRPSTRRVYVAGARAAIRAASLELWQSPTASELLASIGKAPAEKNARISPFLDFLGGGGPKNSVSGEDSATLQNWVIQRLAKQMRFVKNPSIATRRDSGLIAALCAAPAKGTPRKWPESCLKIEGREVLLWEERSRNHASLFPCASGMPGESGWPGQTNGGSTANRSNGANHDSFSPGPTAPPWAGQRCTTLCGDSTRRESATASGPSPRRRSEPLSSVGILLIGSGSSTNSLRVPRRSNSRLRRREAGARAAIRAASVVMLK